MIGRDQHRCTQVRLCAVLLAISTILAADSAHGGTIWIEWDRSADPTVVGYRVSVGTAPGVYTETFEVGSETSFVYRADQDDRIYYLAVAAYAAGPVVGALSAPVSAAPRPVISYDQSSSSTDASDARSFYEALWRTPGAVHHAGSRARMAVMDLSPRVVQLMFDAGAISLGRACEIVNDLEHGGDLSVVEYRSGRAAGGARSLAFVLPAALAEETCNLLLSAADDDDLPSIVRTIHAQ